MGLFKRSLKRMEARLILSLRKRKDRGKLSIRIWVFRLEVGNMLVALGSSGFMLLGVVPMSFPLLLSLAFILFLIVTIGKYIVGIEQKACSKNKTCSIKEG